MRPELEKEMEYYNDEAQRSGEGLVVALAWVAFVLIVVSIAVVWL